MTVLTAVLVSCGNKTDSEAGADGDSQGNGTDQSGSDDGGSNDGDSDSDEFVPNGDGMIFSSAVDVSIVKGSGIATSDVWEIADKVYSLTGKYAITKGDDMIIDSKEIVVGESTRSVTKSAKNAFAREFRKFSEDYEKKGNDAKYLCGYIVYSNGNAVAVYWSHEDVKDLAIEHFVNNYLQNPSLCLKDGYADIQYVDRFELMKSEEAAVREAAYAGIAERYGNEAAEAVREHLSMFDESFYMWLADLYDPGDYDAYGNPLGGGFYYSNSARDNTGFYIDIESTAQALSFLTSAGLLSSSKQIGVLFPEKMQKEMVAFALSCQSSVDGYFYHPQWGTNVQISRISRDLGNAVWILEMMGEIPYWDTPSNVKGSFGAPGAVAPASALSSPLTTDSVSAVSKVLSVAGTRKWTGSAQLATLSAWETYLTNLTAEIRTRSYSIGNTVGSQAAQVKARDALAIENGELFDADENGKADGGYIETFERIFNSLQLENGLWESCSVEEGNVYYAAINGLMKISSAYNGYGVKLNRAEEALSAAAFMITYIGESDDGSDWADSKGALPDGSVDVYNPWVCASTIIKNVTTYDGKEAAEALRESIITPNALEMIKVTTRKISKFRKSDGSYGYTWSSSPSTSQGAPVSVPGSVEGDINGGCIAFTGTFGNMSSVLGFGNLKPFGASDFYAFIDRASSRTHTEKDVFATFDGEAVGAPSLQAAFSGDVGSAVVVEDPREGNRGNVLSFTTVAGKGCSINLTKPDGNSAKSGICLEWEMAFTEINTVASTSFQIKLGSGYMFVIGVSKSGVLTISDSSSTNGSIAVTSKADATFNAKEWNRFKIEFYVLDKLNNTTAAKIYVNDRLVHVSSVYVSKESGKAPTDSYSSASFYALNAMDFTVLFDNIKAYDLVKKYLAETP